MKRLTKYFLYGALALVTMNWGFFGHQNINRLAVFILPPEMIGFYKKNIATITETAVNPDRRRYAVPEEAPRHYIDLDDYGDSAIYKLPRYWEEAVQKFGEDSLQAHGILPWHIQIMYVRLRNAFQLGDPERIIRFSSELGHYIADAHVPLHTTDNYDGQKTNQLGIHAFWESRLPELYFEEYDFFVGKAEYLSDVQGAAWKAVMASNRAKDSVLLFEQNLFKKWGDRKFNFETKGKRTMKVVSSDYAKKYHNLLSGMVERRFRASIKMTGDIWYTAWVDAGQPDLQSLIKYQPTEEELVRRRKELEVWKKRVYEGWEHE